MEINRSSKNIVEEFLDSCPSIDHYTSFRSLYTKNHNLGMLSKYTSAKSQKPDIVDPTLVYDLNCWNFRQMNDKFDDNSFIALGCSDTFGIGNEIEDIWAYKLSKILNKPVWNFGAPGGGIDTCFLNLLLYGDTAKYDTVFFFIPEAYRTYIWYTDPYRDHSKRIQYTSTFRQAETLQLGKASVDPYDLTKGLLFNDENILLTNIVALNAIENYCRNKNVNLIYAFNPFAYHLDEQELKFVKSFGRFGKSRDGVHLDHKFQTAICNLMLKKYKEKVVSDENNSYI